MKFWLRQWTGHLLLIPLAVLALVTLGYVLESARSSNADAMFWNFIIAALYFLATIVVAVVCAWLWRTPSDRRWAAVTRSDAFNHVPALSGPDTSSEGSQQAQEASDA